MDVRLNGGAVLGVNALCPGVEGEKELLAEIEGD